MAGPFDGAWIKWAWGVRHAQYLRDEVVRFTAGLDTEPFRFSVEYDAKRHGFPVVIAEMPQFPDQCGLILGDAAHNLRSALDHIAWAMVERGRTPANTLPRGAVRRIAFPLCDHKVALNSRDTNGWVKSHKSKLPGIRRADLALVRAFQPYQHGKRKAWAHGLGVLGELNNLDKHRTIQPVLAWPMGGSIEIRDPHDCEVPQRVRVKGVGASLEVGTEIACIRVRKTGPNPEVHVKANLVLDVAIYERILLWQWLLGIRDDIATLLHHLGDPPPNIGDVLRSADI